MKVFLDFEASSLRKNSYPIEVAWVFQDGRSESHLIAPAPNWTDWDDAAQAIHGLARDTIIADGEAVEAVATRMIEALSGYDLFASAPSWDGKWLSVLLRTAGFSRHELRLRDTDEALRETAADILKSVVPAARIDVEVHAIVTRVMAEDTGNPAHRALPDALAEHARWLSVQAAARRRAAE